MKRNLLMLLAVLGIATSFTSCDNIPLVDEIPIPFYKVWLFADDANGSDAFEQLVNEDINSDQFDLSIAVINNNELNFEEFRTNLQNDDWFFTHVSSGYKTDRKSINLELWGWSDDSKERYSVVTYSLFFSKLFGDDEQHTLKLQMEYGGEYNISGVPTKVTIDENEITFNVVDYDSNTNYIMINYVAE